MRLGAEIRKLREGRSLRLWEVAPAASMDAGLLSKIERSQRLPTQLQTAVLAKYFSVDPIVWESRRMAEKFFSDNGHNPPAAMLALTHLQESAANNFVNTKRITVNYRTKAVQKSKKNA